MPSTDDFTDRKPGIGVYFPFTAKNLPQVQKHEDPNVIPGFVLTDVKPASSASYDTRVKLFFETRNDESGEITTYSFMMELQYLSIAMALNALNPPAGGVPIYFIDSNKIKPNNKFAVEPSSFEFAIILPLKEYPEGVEFSDKLAALYHPDYAVPLAPVGWDEIISDEEDEDAAIIRAAQSKILMILLGLARGDVAALIELIDFENEIDAYMEDDDDEDEDPEIANIKGMVIGRCADILSIVHTHIRTLAPELKSSIKDVQNTPMSKYDPETDLKFSQLINAPGVSNIFNSVKISPQDKTKDDIEHEKKVEIWNKPFSEAWPKLMKPLKEYLESLEDYESYQNILDTDFSSEMPAEKAQEYGYGKVFTAMVLSLASFAIKKSSLIKREHGFDFPLPIMIAQWLNVYEDEFYWEIPALANSLSGYNVNNATDVFLMYFETLGNIDHLGEAMHIIGHHLTEDDEWNGYNAQKLNDDLESLEITTEEFTALKSWLILYYRKIEEFRENGISEEEDEDSEPMENFCPVAAAASSLIDPDTDIQKLAEVVALAFPVLADIVASKAELEIGSDEWSLLRRKYITTLLTTIAYSRGERGMSLVIH